MDIPWETDLVPIFNMCVAGEGWAIYNCQGAPGYAVIL